MTEFAVPGMMPVTAPKYEADQVFFEFEPHSASDSLWEGVTSIGPVTINGEPPYFPATRAYMMFVPQMGSADACVIFDSEPNADGEVMIDSPSLWAFSIPEQNLPLWPGMWGWSFHVLDSRGESLKLYEGQILINP